MPLFEFDGGNPARRRGVGALPAYATGPPRCELLPRESLARLSSDFYNTSSTLVRQEADLAKYLCKTCAALGSQRRLYTQHEANLAGEGDRPVYSIGAV